VYRASWELRGHGHQLFLGQASEPMVLDEEYSSVTVEEIMIFRELRTAIIAIANRMPLLRINCVKVDHFESVNLAF
jgi:hypothetical protein